MPPIWPFLLLAFVYGCCVGSFLNVVIFRLEPSDELGDAPDGDGKGGVKKDAKEVATPPKAMRPFVSLIYSFWYDLKTITHPPSHCPKCGHGLKAWDNLPVIGWMLLRGKCRYCKNPISPQYPTIEFVCGLIFAGVFFAYYMTSSSPTTGLRPEFMPFAETWPVLLVHFVLIGALLAASAIDARTFHIPLSIPYFAFVVIMIALPVIAQIGFTVMVPGLVPYPGAYASLNEVMPIFSTAPWELGFGLGGGIGWILAVVLMEFGIIPRSFADDEEVHDAPAPSDAKGKDEKGKDESKSKANEPVDMEEWVCHPHLRREISKEMLFVALPIIGAFLGMNYGLGGTNPAPWLAVFGACLTGALVGAGLIWIVRILGSLGFGKEAMGLGDVHLLLPIGAVLGWLEVTIVFFLAPFSGILITVLTPMLRKFASGFPKVLPYGPHLAAAALAMLIARRPILDLLGMLP